MTFKYTMLLLIAGIIFLAFRYYENKKEQHDNEQKLLSSNLQEIQIKYFEFLYMQARSGHWPFIATPQYMADIQAESTYNSNTRSAVLLLRLFTVERLPLNNEDSLHLGTIIQADLNWAFSHGELSYSSKVVSVYNERGAVFVRMEVSI